ncbi:hypothetical protein D3C85_1161950 [compost metagenome]
MLTLNTGSNTGPVKATSVRSASLYQVNTGLVTVVLLAVNLAFVPAQNGVLFPAIAISAAVAGGFTVIVTTLALAGSLGHLLSPLTLT